ncbi:hypothetical protein E4U41_004411 [Claviceps citrina]|nr:hypothetical protein E4U41_004411 [Claviceps citrina]
MARTKKGKRLWKSKTGNTLTRGQGYEQQETSRQIATSVVPAPATGTSTPWNKDYFSKQETIPNERNNTGFTMADIARETSLRDHVAGERSNLRNKPVHFVSCGPSELLKSNFSDQADISPVETMITGPVDQCDQCEFRAKERYQPQSLQALDNATSSSGKPRCMNVLFPSIRMQATEQLMDQNSRTDAFFTIDTIGEKTTGESRPVLSAIIPERHSSPSSSSSGEVILFRGRKTLSEAMSITGIPQRKSLPLMVSTQSQHSTDDLCSLTKTFRPPMSKDKFSKLGKKSKSRGPTDKEEDFLLDYIGNIRENGELRDVYCQNRDMSRDLGGSDGELFFGSDQSGDEIPGGSYLGEDVSRQHPEKNGSISDPRYTGRHEVNKNDGLDNSSDDQDDVATSVAKSMLRPSSSLDMDSINDLSLRNNQEKTKNLNREQVEFDFMDWGRSSLQCLKRGKRVKSGDVFFDHCDSDLERQLQSAWKKDTRRKKERKQQREELRTMGMLRKKAVLDDLRIKYPSGMSITQVADELRSFLQTKKEILTFPPMDKHARKIIHELANTFNVKSKSIGKSEQRRPSLYRTVRTLSYSEAAFDQAVGRIHRQYLPRLDTKGKSTSKIHNKSSASKTAANYQEGEIVGAAAPELGVGNRGRAMLEKMGWSCGTALGAEDNKGILQPVSHAMRRSKAGLG